MYILGIIRQTRFLGLFIYLNIFLSSAFAADQIHSFAEIDKIIAENVKVARSVLSHSEHDDACQVANESIAKIKLIVANFDDGFTQQNLFIAHLPSGQEDESDREYDVVGFANDSKNRSTRTLSKSGKNWTWNRYSLDSKNPLQIVNVNPQNFVASDGCGAFRFFYSNFNQFR